MVLKVKASILNGVTVCPTEMLQTLTDHQPKQALVLPEFPKLQIRPTSSQKGLIEFNRQKLLLDSDYTFLYGAWPQDKVPLTLAQQLNAALFDKTLRKDGRYYTVAGKAYHEYEWNQNRYVLMTGQTQWFRVQPVQWIWDDKRQKAYTTCAFFPKVNSETLKSFGWQVLQSNKFMRDRISKTEQNTVPVSIRRLKFNLLHTLRLLRDAESSQGAVAPATQSAYNLFMHSIRHKTEKQK